MPSNHKTLLVTLDFPPLVGGVANYYFNRVKQMPKDEIIVLMNQFANYQLPALPAGRPITSYNFEVIYKSFFTKLFYPHWLPLIWHIYRIVKKEKITRLWVGQILPVGSAVWIVSRILSFGRSASWQTKFRINFFVTCHGNDLLRAKSHPRKFKLAKKILEDAEYIEANTEFTKNILINDFKISAEKIYTIYPFNTLKKEMVNREKVEELRKKYNLDNKKVLITVGRLVKSKAIDLVLQALPLVLEKVPNLIYIIIGDGPHYAELVRISSEFSRINNNIIFVGAVPHNDLPNYYTLANAFILTPRNSDVSVETGFKPVQDTESFGIVYLEAQEFNLPIIASNVGGVGEAVKGYDKINFVNPENVSELATKIIEVLM